MAIYDSLVNFVAQMGTTGKSKLANDAFTFTERSLIELTALYRGDWIGRKIVDAPVYDMLREWRAWQAEPHLITAIEAAEKKHDIKRKISRATRLGRLYGGGAIIIGADVQNPEKPLNAMRIGKGGLQYLTVVSRHALSTPEIDRDPRSPTFGQPFFYELHARTGTMVRLHPSRVIRFLGADRLDDDLAIIDCWSDSTLLAAYDAIHHAAMTQTAIAELVHEAKVDVIRVDNLGAALGNDAGTSQLVKRFSNANMLKSLNNMLLLDKNEEWDRKQTSFANLPDVIDRYLQIVCAASDIPATRLLGMTTKGLNNSGEGDLRNYYDMLAGMRGETIGAQLEYLDRILWIDAIGAVPKDAYFEWRPIWQMAPREKADIAKVKADTTKIYAELGLIDETALREGATNQLIEDGVYPGLEAAIAEIQSSLNGKGQEPTAENDNPEADSPVRDIRGLGYHAWRH